MARTNKDRVSPATPASARGATPWVSSGVVSAGTVIKNAPGILGGVIVTASDTDGDIDIIVWDSPDATLTSDVELCRVTITSATDHVQASFSSPSEVGVEAENGLYVQIVAGDCEVIVYYR